MALPLWNSKTTQTTLSCLHPNGGAPWGFVGVDSLKPSTMLAVLAGQVTRVLGFCGQSSHITEHIHWRVPKFPRNLKELDGSCTKILGISSMLAGQLKKGILVT